MDTNAIRDLTEAIREQTRVGLKQAATQFAITMAHRTYEAPGLSKESVLNPKQAERNALAAEFKIWYEWYLKEVPA
jgi:hypothetical protein